MIPPAHVSKPVPAGAGTPKRTSADPAQWQQAVKAVSPTVPKPVAVSQSLPAKEPSITLPDLQLAVAVPPSAKKPVPLTRITPAPEKKNATPTIMTTTIPAAGFVIPASATAPELGHIASGNVKPKPADDASMPTEGTSATPATAPGPVPEANAPDPQPAEASVTVVIPQRTASPHIPEVIRAPIHLPDIAATPPAAIVAVPSIMPEHAETKQNSVTPVPIFGAVTGTVLTQAAASVPAVPAAPLPAITPDAASLASAVTAMHQSGETTATMQLDPPGFGTLTIHLGIGQNSAVNVQFITAVPQTTQIIANHLNDLRDAMANAGLSLGSTHVGSGNGGGNGASPQNNPPSSPQPPAIAPVSITPPAGIRAYA